MNSATPRTLPVASSRVFEGALVRVDRLRREIEELERAHEERDDLDGTRILLQALRSIVYEFERYTIKRARGLYEKRDSQPDNESFRQRVGGHLLSLEMLLPNPLAIARQPFGQEIEALITPFAEVARLISPGRELIFLPAAEYEFNDTLKESLVEFTDNLSVQLSATLKELPQLTVITYPRFLDGDLLLHTVIAHEITHLAYEREHPENPGAPLGRTLIGVSVDAHYDELQRFLASRLDSGASEVELDEADRKARRRINRWFEELACDQLALLMVGPAYLFALFDLETPGNRWAQREQSPGYTTHPGLAWRIERLLPLAHDFFPAAETGEAFAAGREALDGIESVLPDESDEIGPIERQIIEEALAEISKPEHIAAALPSNADYKRKDTFVEEIDLVWDKLACGIPPSERILGRSTQAVAADREFGERWSRPMDWRSILNGSYLHWLAGRARTPEKEGRLRSMPLSPHAVTDWHDFNAFVRGTIELAVIHEQAIDVRNRLQRANPPRES